MCDSIGATQGLDENEEFVQNNVPKQPDGWGVLLPLSNHYPCISLTKDKVQIGRVAEYELSRSDPYFFSISKVHFEIYKEGENAFLCDRSSNGTFIDEQKVGKNNKRALGSNMIISLCSLTNRAFLFRNFQTLEPPTPSQVAEKYTITKRLGSGAYGEVKLAFRNSNNEAVAVKIIPKKKLSRASNSSQAIESEMKIMKKLSHPCIVNLEEAIETDDSVYLVLELVQGGELFQRVEKKEFEEWEAKILFYQMVLAIKYLHDNNIVHRDLKPENILMKCPDKNITLIKITDFGLSKFLDGQTMLTTMCGTPNYLAPEVIRDSGLTPYSNAVDVWSLGVILFICLVGYPPFSEDREDFSMKQQILEGKVDYPECFWSGVSKDAKELVQRMLTVDVNKRIMLSDVLNHPWLTTETRVKDIVDLLMQDKDCSHLIAELTDPKPPTKKKK